MRGLHRADQADFVHFLAQMRKKVGHYGAATRIGTGRPLASHDFFLPGSIAPFRHRLGIKRINVRHTARGIKENNPLCSGREMRGPGRQRMKGIGGDDFLRQKL